MSSILNPLSTPDQFRDALANAAPQFADHIKKVPTEIFEKLHNSGISSGFSFSVDQGGTPVRVELIKQLGDDRIYFTENTGSISVEISQNQLGEVLNKIATIIANNKIIDAPQNPAPIAVLDQAQPIPAISHKSKLKFPVDFTSLSTTDLSKEIGIAAALSLGDQENVQKNAQSYLIRDEKYNQKISFIFHLSTQEGDRKITLSQNFMDGEKIHYWEEDGSQNGKCAPYELDSKPITGRVEVRCEEDMKKVLKRMAGLMSDEAILRTGNQAQKAALPKPGPMPLALQRAIPAPVPTLQLTIVPERSLSRKPEPQPMKPHRDPKTEFGQETEKFLKSERAYYLEKAWRTGKPVVLSKRKDRVPESMVFFPDGTTAVHLKSWDRAPNGTLKMYKKAVMIDLEGERSTVARLVAHTKESDSLRGRALNEISALQMLQGRPSQIVLYEYRMGVNKRGEEIVTMYVQNFSEGNIENYLSRNKGTISREEKLKIATGLIKSLNEQHKLGLVHRDVKSENGLYSPRSGAVMADLDISQKLGDIGQVAGTSTYFSPEKEASRKMGTWTTQKDLKADVYAMGLVLYEVLIGELPPGISNNIKTREGSAASAIGTILPALDSSDPINGILSDMLQFDPVNRPDMATVLAKWNEAIS